MRAYFCPRAYSPSDFSSQLLVFPVLTPRMREWTILSARQGDGYNDHDFWHRKEPCPWASTVFRSRGQEIRAQNFVPLGLQGVIAYIYTVYTCIYIYIYIYTYNYIYGDEHRRHLADNVLKNCSIHFGNGKLMNISCHFLGGYVSPYIQQSTSADQLFALSIQSYLAPSQHLDTKKIENSYI